MTMGQKPEVARESLSLVIPHLMRNPRRIGLGFVLFGPSGHYAEAERSEKRGGRLP